jgi:hypothetical protein
VLLLAARADSQRFGNDIPEVELIYKNLGIVLGTYACGIRVLERREIQKVNDAASVIVRRVEWA